MIILYYKVIDMKIKKIAVIILPIILLIVIGILILTNKQDNWIDKILKTDYEIYSLSCDGTTNILNKEVLKDIKNNWKNLSNNGPFLGNLNTCYKKIIIDYNNNVVDIEIVDKNSIIIKKNSNDDFYTYYTNANNLINELDKYFK